MRRVRIKGVRRHATPVRDGAACVQKLPIPTKQLVHTRNERKRMRALEGASSPQPSFTVRGDLVSEMASSSDAVAAMPFFAARPAKSRMYHRRVAEAGRSEAPRRTTSTKRGG